MASSTTKMVLEIIGVDKASHAFEKVSRSISKTEDRAKKLKIAGGLALVALTGAAVEFGKKSVDKFQEVGGETLRLQRILGGTAEQASRLRFAGEETGVGVDKLSIGFGILSKHLTANDKAWKSAGISARDANGNLRPMSDLIPALAEKFSKMPAGAQKTAMALNLFGRSGKDLLPFLNRGSDGLKELGKESDKFGDTLNSKDTAAVYRNIIAKRQLNAAVAGLQIQLGQHLVPALASVVTWLTSLTLWLGHLSPVAQTVVKVAVAVVGVIFLVVKATKAWIAVQTALDVVLTANPIGLVIVAIAALVAGIIIAYKHSATFRAIVQGAFGGIASAGRWMWGVLKPIFAALMAAFRAAETAASFVSNLAGHGGPSLASLPRSPAEKRGLRGHAAGTLSAPAGLAWVGERGPELMRFRGGEQVYNASQSARMAAGGTGMISLTVNYLGGSSPAEQAKFGRFVEQSLQALRRKIQVETA